MTMRTRPAFRKMVLSVVVVSLWLSLGALLPWADDTPPPDPLFIGDGVGGLCPKGGTGIGTFPPSGAPGSGACWVYDKTTAVSPPTTWVGPAAPFSEVNELTTAGKLDIFKNGNSFDALNNPILLIFAIPNVNLLTGAAETAALTAASVTGASLYHPLSTFATGLTVNFGTTAFGGLAGHAGTLTAGGNIYSDLGLGGRGCPPLPASQILCWRTGMYRNNYSALFQWIPLPPMSSTCSAYSVALTGHRCHFMAGTRLM